MSELKHQLLGKKKSLLPVLASELPELGTDLYIRRMSGDEYDTYLGAQRECAKESETLGDIAFRKLTYLLLSLTICDDKGVRIFEKPDELKELDQVVSERLAIRASDHNGLTLAAREAIEKKLKSNGTGTTSPGSSESSTLNG